MKYLFMCLIVVASQIASAENSAPVKLIQDLGLSEFTCQYRVPVQDGNSISFSKPITLYAIDTKTAYSICLARIGALVVGEDGNLRLMATTLGPKALYIDNVLVARTK